MKKKILLIMLAIALALTFILSGCGTYKQGIVTTPPVTDSGKPGDKDKEDDPSDDGLLVFTVTLVRNGMPFSPGNNVINAQWAGDEGNYTAQFNAAGVATAKGLDGEYRVTLSDLPANYTYNPNGNNVDNNNRDIIIELLQLSTASGRGTGLYNCKKIDELGRDRIRTYRTELQSQSDIVYYEFEPIESGIYTIESWVDITANEINPVMNYHNGNKSWKNEYYEEYNSGGPGSTFTKNFRFGIELPRGYVGNVWTFGLHAYSKINYPVTIDFSIRYIGEYSEEETRYETVIAKGPFWDGSDSMGIWQYNYADTGRVLKGSRYRLYWEDINGDGEFNPGDEWIKDTNGNGVFDPGDEWQDLNGNGICDSGEWKDTNGNGVFDPGDEWKDLNGNGICDNDIGDGFYHVYDPELYPEGYTDEFGTYPAGYGPILFAKISKDNEVLVTQDQTSDSGEASNGGMGFTNPLVRLTFGGYDYSQFIRAYASYCDSAGAHPVTEELKLFLQRYAVKERMFNDGNGTAEYAGLNSSEEDQWLFACGYYRR